MKKKLKLAKSKSTSYLKLPFDFLENHFQNLDPVCIKVYLYIMYLCTLGDIEFNEIEIARRLNLTQSEITKSYETLRNIGLLINNNETFEDELIPLEDFYKNYQKENNDEIKKGLKEVINEVSEDKVFKKRLSFIEEVYKKELTQNDFIEIYDLLENQKVPYEVLLAAIEYSISKNKRSFNYISKVAMNWKELGLTNYESCENYINSEKLDEDKLFKNLKRIFKLDRDFFEVEIKYIEEWCYNKKKTIDDIKKAFETTVLNTGKLSFPYMNAILLNDKTEFSSKPISKKTAMHNFKERDYDFNDILSAIRKNQKK